MSPMCSASSLCSSSIGTSKTIQRLIVSAIPAHYKTVKTTVRTTVKKHWKVVSLAVQYPFHFAEIRLQLAMGPQVNGEFRFHGLVDCLRKSVRMGGFQSLYTGLAVEVLGYIAREATAYTLFSALEDALGEDGAPEAVAWSRVLVEYPFRTVQVRMVMQAGGKAQLYTGPLDCAARILAEEGAAGFYQGFLIEAGYLTVRAVFPYIFGVTFDSVLRKCVKHVLDPVMQAIDHVIRATKRFVLLESETVPAAASPSEPLVTMVRWQGDERGCGRRATAGRQGDAKAPGRVRGSGGARY